MSDASDYEQAPEKKEEKEPEPEPEKETETIPIVEETDLALPLPPPPEEEEWLPGAGQPKLNASPFPTYLFGAIPVILGVISLLLLLSCGFFGYQYFQSVQFSENRMKSLNESMESIKVKTLDGIQKIVNENKGTLINLENQNKNLSHKVDEILQELKTQKEKGCKSCQHPWEQHGNFCYSRTQKMVSWSNCSDICESSNATFLNTERSKLKVILTSLAVNHTWIGLSSKEGVNQSLWDCYSSSSTHQLFSTRSEHHNNSCVYANACTLRTELCVKQFSCLCEKAVS